MTNIEKKYWALRNLTKEKTDSYFNRPSESSLEEMNNVTQEYANYCETLIGAMLEADPDLFNKIFI